MVSDIYSGKDKERVLHQPPKAIVHLGASAASMLVYQQLEQGEIQEIEFLEHPLPLGRDIFRKGRFSNETLDLAVSALKRFQEVLREYGDKEAQPERVVATNILSEAANTDVFLNRLNIGCGLDVEALDDGEMTRLIFLETQHLLREHEELNQGKTLIVHVGPGNTRIMLLEKGRIKQYGNYRLGTHRIGQSQATDELAGAHLTHHFSETVRSKVESIELDYKGEKIDRIVSIGYEIQNLTAVFSSEEGNQFLLKKIDREIEIAQDLSVDERIRRHKADHFSGDAMIPAALINARIAESFGLKQVFIPQTEYERGLLRNLPSSALVTESFAREVRQSAISLARKYKVHEEHGLHVETLCTQLFHALQEYHQLDQRYLLFLRIAAITHEVGNFISEKAHHKHSLYIIANSEIFGLSAKDTEFVATIARYHRHSPPKPSHKLYADMDQKRRLSISKLAAILRLADALERAHNARLSKLDLHVRAKQLRIGTGNVLDLSIENQALAEKGEFFRNVYGLKPVLVPGKA